MVPMIYICIVGNRGSAGNNFKMNISTKIQPIRGFPSMQNLSGKRNKMNGNADQKQAQRFQQRRKLLSTGDLLVPINFGMWDLFSGKGFSNWTRIKISKNRQTNNFFLLTLSGTPLS